MFLQCLLLCVDMIIMLNILNVCLRHLEVLGSLSDWELEDMASGGFRFSEPSFKNCDVYHYIIIIIIIIIIINYNYYIDRLGHSAMRLS